MAVLKVYNGATWDEPVLKFHNGTSFVTPLPKYYNGTSWVDLAASGPSVVIAATKTIYDFATDPAISYAYVKVDNDGGLYAGTPAYAFYETWLDSGLNSEVWVQRTIVSGTLSVDAGSGRLACTSDRIFGVSQTPDGLKTCVIDLEFYDAASGGTLLDVQRVTLTAETDPGD